VTFHQSQAPFFSLLVVRDLRFFWGGGAFFIEIGKKNDEMDMQGKKNKKQK